MNIDRYKKHPAHDNIWINELNLDIDSNPLDLPGRLPVSAGIFWQSKISPYIRAVQAVNREGPPPWNFSNFTIESYSKHRKLQV